jgi:uncharacterized protein YdaU (DUF1376 family)
MHYYKRNLGDYAKKAGRLTMLQHGAYTLLIDSCYDREVFPTLEQAIEWTWASNEAEIEAVKFVLSRFFTLGIDGQYVQDRILAELLNYHKNADINKRIADEREAKRKEKRTDRAHAVYEPPPNQEPLTKNHKPIDTPVGVSVDVWQDFVKLRKAKKAPVTDNVVKLIQKEADLAGWSMDQALAECVVRGWQSFKADWVKPKPTFGDIAKTTVPSSNVRDPALQKLDEDAKSTKPPPAEILAKIREFAGVKNELL